MNVSLRGVKRSYSSLIPSMILPGRAGMNASREGQLFIPHPSSLIPHPLPCAGGWRRLRLIPERLKIHLGRNVRARGAAEVGLWLEPKRVRDEVRRELDYGRVELLSDLVVAAALDGNAVLRPFELRLQLEEVRVRFEIGIALHDHEQPRQRVAQRALCRLELAHGLRIV